ncbi:MAG: helix-turn-helix domain-containing protein [Bacteroidota bacterium]|nr:helix-turn-helix domain-containing protein [Bacteroidota bacterium]
MNILDQIKKSFELREQGYSIREIANEIGVSKSTVDRWLKTENEVGTDGTASGTLKGHEDYPPEQHISKPPKNDSEVKSAPELEKNNIMLELKRLELQHVREMEILRQKDRELSLMELQQRNQNFEIELKRQELNHKNQERFDELQKEMKRIANKKSELLKKFKNLIKEYKDHGRSNFWSIERVKKYVKTLETLKEDIEILSNEIAMEYKDLSSWYYLDFYVDHINELLLENENSFWGGNYLKLDLSEAEIKELDEIIAISDFEEKIGN